MLFCLWSGDRLAGTAYFTHRQLHLHWPLAAVVVAIFCGKGAVGANECPVAYLRQQRVLASLFYSHRKRLDREQPHDFEDPIFSYPEKSAASDALLENVEGIDKECGGAAVLELLLDAERHVSLLARTSEIGELLSNATLICERLLKHAILLNTVSQDETTYMELLDVAFSHLSDSLDRLGIHPGRFCKQVLSSGKLPYSVRLTDVKVHRKCTLAKTQAGHHNGSWAGRECRAPDAFAASQALRLLPAAALAALEARVPSALWGVEKGGCGVRKSSRRLPDTQGWQVLGSGLHSQSCSMPFLTYWPFPLLTVTRCKYCTVGSILGLRPGDRILDFGAGCGFGASWLAEAFGVDATVIDAMAHHVEGADENARQAGVKLAASCVGDIAALAAFPDGEFDAVLTNSVLQITKSFAVQCATLRSHFIRLLRVGGALWWGDLNSVHHEFRSDESQWHACLAPLAEARTISYAIVPEVNTFGVSETWDGNVFSLLVVRLRPVWTEMVEMNAVKSDWLQSTDQGMDADAETWRQASLYTCKAALDIGFSFSSKALEALNIVPETMWSPTVQATLRPFVAGPSYWVCAEDRLWRETSNLNQVHLHVLQPKKLAPRVWGVEQFASDDEVMHLVKLITAWKSESAAQFFSAFEVRRDLVEDVIVPSGTDAVLDAIEDRLERRYGLPRVHADPWHALYYKPGYDARWPHTDCHHPGFDPQNDRYVTVLMWLSPCSDLPEDWRCGLQASVEPIDGSDEGENSGATIFPYYGLRVRLDAGGIVLYSSYTPGPAGVCDNSSRHYASALSSNVTGPKLILQKWYYAKPVEPSSPSVPQAVCENVRRGQCKTYVLAPESGSLVVQSRLAAAERAIETRPMMDLQSVRTLVSSKEVVALQEALEQEVDASSLGSSGHWRAMYILGNLKLIHWQIEPRRAELKKEALNWIRAAMHRCPVCEDVLSLFIRALADEGVPALHAEAVGGITVHDMQEAFAYVRRLAALGVVGATALAHQFAPRSLSGEAKHT